MIRAVVELVLVLIAVAAVWQWTWISDAKLLGIGFACLFAAAIVDWLKIRPPAR